MSRVRWSQPVCAVTSKTSTSRRQEHLNCTFLLLQHTRLTASTAVQQCTMGNGWGSSLTGDHGWANNIKPEHLSARTSRAAAFSVSQSHFSTCSLRRTSPWVCDPSNGKRCIIEKRAGELMKRGAGWHFQSDVWSRMTFTEKRRSPKDSP